MTRADGGYLPPSRRGVCSKCVRVDLGLMVQVIACSKHIRRHKKGLKMPRVAKSYGVK